MVFLTSDCNSQNAKPRNSLILQKLKQARAEHEAQKDQTLPQDAPNASKKFVHKKSSKIEISSSSSSSSPELEKLRLMRRSTVQERLFAAQCQQSRQNFEKYRSKRNELESSTGTIKRMQRPRAPGNSNHKFQKYNGYNNNNDDDNDDDNDNAYYGNNRSFESDDEGNRIGVLHLKKPLKLTESDELNYFNGTSRMKPIDWSLVKAQPTHKNKNTGKKFFKNRSPSKEIVQSSNVLPIGDTDFINFVNNSTSKDTVYRVHNKLKESIKSATESPILKIQKAIRQCKADAITVTQEIRESFESSPQEPKIIDSIDKVPVNSSSFQNSPPQTSRLHSFKNNVNALMQKIQQRNIEEFKRNQLKEVKDYSLKNHQLKEVKDDSLKNHELKEVKDYSLKNHQLKEVKDDSLNILNNNSRMAERKKMIEECNDDMIGFVKPNSPSTSSSLVSCGNSDKKLDIDENSDPAYITRKLMEKIKNSRISRMNNSLDSDDVSTERSSELDDLSATRRSTISKYETLKKRLFSVSTQTSPMKKSIDKVNKNHSLSKNIEKINMDKCEEEPLMKECSTRYLKPSAVIVDKTVHSEIEEDIRKEGPLLKPVFTRYFSTLSKEEKHSNESKSKSVIEENIIQVTVNDSNSSELNISNEESISKESNGEIEEIIPTVKKIEEITSDSKKIEETILEIKEIEEMVSESKGIEEIVLNSKEIEEITSDSKKVEEIVLYSKEIEEIASDSKEVEEIVLDSKEIEEISKDNCVTSSSEESILNVADNKIENDRSSDSTTASNCENNDSEESSKESNQSDEQSLQPLYSKEEKDINSKEEIITEEIITGYEDIDSEEEYDIVNFEQFSAFTSLLNNLKAVAAAQKEHALSIANELNNNDIDENDSQSHLKAIESSLDSSDNNYSSVNASISSNLESDNENSVISSSSSNLLLENKNVFENINIDVKHLNNYQFQDDEISNAIEGVNKQTGMSGRLQKKANALKNYHKSKDNDKGGNQVAQKNNAVQNEILGTKEFIKRNQILEEIKKQKLHLTCKPWSG